MAVTMEQEIVEQEERLADAKRALDLGAIDRIYADDLLLTGVMGEPTCSKTAVIDEVKRGIAERDRARVGGQPMVMSAVNEDMKVVRHGDTAIANYRFVVKITTSTADIARRYRATNVWKQKNGRWQIIAAHMSFVLDPAQAGMLAGEGR